MKNTKRVIKEKTTVDNTTGEILSKETEFQFSKEPNYIKLYFDCLGVYISNDGLTASLNDMFVEVLKRSTYAEDGQIVHLDAYTKERICKATGKGMERLKQAIRTWTHNKILIRVARGVYQVNPYIIGKGDWRNVSKLRATFDFTSGSVSMSREYQTQTDNAQTASEGVVEPIKQIHEQEHQEQTNNAQTASESVTEPITIFPSFPSAAAARKPYVPVTVRR